MFPQPLSIDYGADQLAPNPLRPSVFHKIICNSQQGMLKCVDTTVNSKQTNKSNDNPRHGLTFMLNDVRNSLVPHYTIKRAFSKQ